MKCNKSKRLSYTKKAKEIVNSLTLEEKVSLMGGNVTLNDMLSDLRDADERKHYNSYPYPAGGIEKDNVPPMLFCDGPRGVVCSAGKAHVFQYQCLEVQHLIHH